MTVTAAPADPAPVVPAPDCRLTLWCLSDLALLDENGQPTLEPTPERLGLGSGRVDWEKSFLRFRAYAPWNAYRRAYDLERQVIRRGSVIALELDQTPAATTLAALQAGAGLWREGGLGRVWVNPPLLATEQPSFAVPERREATSAPVVPRPNHPLVRWLEQQRDAGGKHQASERKARELSLALQDCYRLARTYAGLTDDVPVGPSPSQWGSVLAKAKESIDRESLRRTLFDGANAVGEGWKDTFRDAEGLRSFHAWFQSQLPADLDAIRAFARRAMALARREHGRADPKEKSA